MRREDLTLLPGSSGDGQPIIALTTFTCNICPCMSIGPEEPVKLSLNHAMGKFVPSLVLRWLLMGLHGVTAELFLSSWTYLMVTGSSDRCALVHIAEGPANFSWSFSCKSTFPYPYILLAKSDKAISLRGLCWYTRQYPSSQVSKCFCRIYFLFIENTFPS